MATTTLKLQLLQTEIKLWQAEFEAANGHKPTASDLQKNPDIVTKLKLVQTLSKAAKENVKPSSDTQALAIPRKDTQPENEETKTHLNKSVGDALSPAPTDCTKSAKIGSAAAVSDDIFGAKFNKKPVRSASVQYVEGLAKATKGGPLPPEEKTILIGSFRPTKSSNSNPFRKSHPPPPASSRSTEKLEIESNEDVKNRPHTTAVQKSFSHASATDCSKLESLRPIVSQRPPEPNLETGTLQVCDNRAQISYDIHKQIAPIESKSTESPKEILSLDFGFEAAPVAIVQRRGSALRDDASFLIGGLPPFAQKNALRRRSQFFSEATQRIEERTAERERREMERREFETMHGINPEVEPIQRERANASGRGNESQGMPETPKDEFDWSSSAISAEDRKQWQSIDDEGEWRDVPVPERAPSLPREKSTKPKPKATKKLPTMMPEGVVSMNFVRLNLKKNFRPGAQGKTPNAKFKRAMKAGKGKVGFKGKWAEYKTRDPALVLGLGGRRNQELNISDEETYMGEAGRPKEIDPKTDVWQDAEMLSGGTGGADTGPGIEAVVEEAFRKLEWDMQNIGILETPVIPDGNPDDYEFVYEIIEKKNQPRNENSRENREGQSDGAMMETEIANSQSYSDDKNDQSEEPKSCRGRRKAAKPRTRKTKPKNKKKNSDNESEDGDASEREYEPKHRKPRKPAKRKAPAVKISRAKKNTARKSNDVTTNDVAPMESENESEVNTDVQPTLGANDPEPIEVECERGANVEIQSNSVAGTGRRVSVRRAATKRALVDESQSEEGSDYDSSGDSWHGEMDQSDLSDEQPISEGESDPESGSESDDWGVVRPPTKKSTTVKPAPKRQARARDGRQKKSVEEDGEQDGDSDTELKPRKTKTKSNTKENPVPTRRVAGPDSEVAFADPRVALHYVYGFTAFRPGQDVAVRRMIEGQSTLVIQPTGAGKSLCYQLPAYIHSLRGPSLVLVVCPLVSLMADQIKRLPKKIKGACINSEQTQKQRDKVIADARAGNLQVLFVSPEMVVSEGFQNLLQGKEWKSGAYVNSAPFPQIPFVCIDEAHCVSEWSHNFRPAYLRLGKVIRERMGVKCVLALTATATVPCLASIIKYFGIPHSGVVRGVMVPRNLQLCASYDDDKGQALLHLLQLPNFQGSVIVYCARQSHTEEVAHYLQARGIDAACYHAGLMPHERRRVQGLFMADKIRVIAATIAFGMGLDKPNIRGVVHYHMPKSVENYVQEVGRAGRDGMQSHCHLLLDKEDVWWLRSRAHSDTVDEHTVAHFLDKVFLLSQSECPDVCAISIEGSEQELDMTASAIFTLLCKLEQPPHHYIEILAETNARCVVRMSKNLAASLRETNHVAAALMKRGKEDNSGIKWTASLQDLSLELKSDIKAVARDLRLLGRVKGVGVSLEDRAYCYRIRKHPNKAEVHALHTYLMGSMRGLEEFQRRKVEILYGIMSVAAPSNQSAAELYRHGNEGTRDSIGQTIRTYTRMYFQADLEQANQKEGDAGQHLTNLIRSSELEVDDRTKAAIRHEIRAFVQRHGGYVTSSRAIARILHGMHSPCFQARDWRQQQWWNRFLHYDFNLLRKIAEEELENFTRK